MSACPNRAVWSEFLADRVDRSLQASLTDHAESCADCIVVLNSLTEFTEDTALRSGASAVAVGLTGPVAHELQGLRRLLMPDTEPASIRRNGDRALPTLPGYDIEEELDRGGMGVVYKARHVKLSRPLAIKMILAAEHAPRNQVLRFLIEAETLARLQHPNIVQVHEVGEHLGRPFLVMEYVAGGTLKRHCGRPVPPRLAAELVVQLARATHFAHQQGVIHRDLKPSNVLLQVSDQASGEGNRADRSELEFATLKVTDFGLAKQIRGQSELTQTGEILGTAEYMAPEQAGADPRKVGPGADIYALGVILYELLTGAPPFRSETALHTLQKAQRDEPVPPSRLLKGLPKDLNAICLKCLDKEPGGRYSTAGDLAEDLQRFLANEPIRARPIGQTGRLLRWCRRSPAIASLVGLAALLLGTITIGSVVAAVRINAANRTALAALAESRQRLVRLNATIGDRYLEKGESQTALLWYIESWLQDRNSIRREAGHLLRVAATLDRGPRLEGVCFHGTEVVQADYDPVGRRVLTRVKGPDAYLWDPARSRLVVPPLRHAATVLHVAFSPNGRTIATASADQTARLWDAGTGRPRCEPLAHPGAVHFVAFTQDGSQLATACEDGQVRFWQTAAGALGRTLRVSETAVLSVGFSPDESLLVTADRAQKARVHRVGDGEPLGPPLAHGVIFAKRSGLQRVRLPQFSRDGRRLLTTAGRTVSVRDVGSGRRAKVYTLAGEVRYAELSPDGDRFLTGVASQSRVIDVVSGEDVFDPIGHPRETLHGAFSPDGRLVATASTGGVVRVRDSRSGQEVGVGVHQIDFDNLRALRFSPDSRRLLVACQDGTVREWDLLSLPTTRDYNFACGSAHRLGEPYLEGSERRRYSPDGTRRLQFGQGPGVDIVSRTTGAPAGPRLEIGETVDSATFSSDGTRVWTIVGARVQAWHASSGRPAGPPVSIARAPSHICASANASRLCTLDAARQTLDVWDLDRGELVLEGRTAGATPQHPGAPEPRHRLEFSDRIANPALSPDGQRVVMKIGINLIQVYDVDSGRRTSAFQSEGVLGPIEFGPDSRRFAVPSSNTTARAWSTESDGGRARPIGPLLKHPTFVRAASFSSDGERLVTYCSDGTVSIWDAVTGESLMLPVDTGAHAPRGWWFSRDGRSVVILNSEGICTQLDLPVCRPVSDQMLDLARLVTGQEMVQTGPSYLLPMTFINDRARYRRAWLAWRGLTDDPAAQP
jgi:WD40 repeat protein/tRNA A-37 threonylcarbamoyl transferase component Bud32